MNGRRLIILALALLALVFPGTASVAAAAGGCYTPAAYEAEQGLRIHSQLMVIGLTCQRMPGASGIYAKYHRFTEANRDIIRDYENEIIAHFRRNGSSAPEKDFHALRTSIANDVSTQAMSMRVDRFCRQFMPVLSQALQMNGQQVRQWVVSAPAPSSLPACQRVAVRN